MKEYFPLQVNEVTYDLMPSFASITSTLLGITAIPLFLVAIYFYKINPVFFTREHLIALSSVMAGLMLMTVSVAVSNLGTTLASIQLAPAINQVFVGSFSPSPGCIFSVLLSLVSIYLSMIGYMPSTLEKPFPFILAISLVAMAMVFCIRAFDLMDYVKTYVKDIQLSDIAFTAIFTAESAYSFVASVALFYWAGFAHPFIYLLTNPCFLIPMEKALYYYPATVVIPMFSVTSRFLGAALVGIMFKDSFNLFVFLSLFTGFIGSFFPLVLTS